MRLHQRYKALFIQLPVPQHNYAMQTGNIPLAGAYLYAAIKDNLDWDVEVLPESITSWSSDQLIIQEIIKREPDVIGFTLYNWNVERSLWIAKQIKGILPVRIIAGGPEVTKDNAILNHEVIDIYVEGEGEEIIQLLLAQSPNPEHFIQATACKHLERFTSPYLNGILEPWIEKSVLIETQRGCPYRCGFCYYNKSRSELYRFSDKRVLDTMRWAYEQKDVEQVYLLDPSLNSRPFLHELLQEIKTINYDRKLKLNSEIRAETITRKAAESFAEAGFVEFEIGLQSINPVVLQKMNRQTDLQKFIKGCKVLQEAGIVPKIDLLVGLPGDTIEGFKQSVDFVEEHQLQEAIQVFVLSILPGTDFRLNTKTEELQYQHKPPYLVRNSQGFKEEDIFESLTYAESAFDLTFDPMPYLEVSHIGCEKEGWRIQKVVIATTINWEKAEEVSLKLANPYQLHFQSDKCPIKDIIRIIELFTARNPYTPFEIVQWGDFQYDLYQLTLDYAKIVRPSFLDNDLRYNYLTESNRTVVFTHISNRVERTNLTEMGRQVYHWKRLNMPSEEDMESFSHLDGILIDNGCMQSTVLTWIQSIDMNNLPLQVGFSNIENQYYWLQQNAKDAFYLEEIPKITYI